MNKIFIYKGFVINLANVDIIRVKKINDSGYMFYDIVILFSSGREFTLERLSYENAIEVVGTLTDRVRTYVDDILSHAEDILSDDSNSETATSEDTSEEETTEESTTSEEVTDEGTTDEETTDEETADEESSDVSDEQTE